MRLPRSDTEVICVAPGISLGSAFGATVAPSGMLKLSKIRKASKEASKPLAKGRAEAVSAAARINRDGGVKSPGKPRRPEPAPKGLSANEPIVRFSRGVEDRCR